MSYEIIRRGARYAAVGPDGQTIGMPCHSLELARERIDVHERRRHRRLNRRERSCITCRAAFLSEGAHNRMCPICRRQGDNPLAP